MRGVSSWTRVFWKRRRGGAMCPVFSQQPCSLSFIWDRAVFRQRSVMRIAISELTLATTATRAANRADLPRFSKETNCDAIPENGNTSITILLRPRRRPRHPPSPHLDRRPFLAPLTHPDSCLAASTGMSGLMMLSPRRRTPHLGSGCTAQALIRPAGRRRDAGDGDLSATSPLPAYACSQLSLSSRFGKRH